MSVEYVGCVPFIKKQFVVTGTTFQGTFPYYLFSLTLNGRAEYELPERSFSVGPGDVLHFSPQSWQDWRVEDESGWDVWYLIVDLPTDLQELLPESNVSPGISLTGLDEKEVALAEAAFAEMYEWNNSPSSLVGRLFLNRLEYVLLLLRNRQPVFRNDPRVCAAREFLHSRIEHPTRLSEVAQAACLSVPRLCALFKDEFGISPLSYLEKLRMERAAQSLLFTVDDIGSIARRLGYIERKYFDKRFKLHWGITPRKYRLTGRLIKDSSQ